MGTNKVRILAAAVVLAFAPLAHAQTTEIPAPNAGQTLVATKIASNFSDLAGGEDNALALVRSLRTGTDVSLVTTVPVPEGSPPGTLPTTTTTTFTPPTKSMGWGNVKHSLALARDQLARAGITNPTAEQLQTALMGGDLVRVNADGTTTTTAVKGILTMRADGMGWGNIAKEGGTKLGHVQKVDMSAKGVKSTTPSTTGVTTAAAGASTTTVKSKGVTTAGGRDVSSASAKGSKGITTAAGGSAAAATGKGHSKGLVTASGASANANPQGNAHGRGIVTAAGGGTTNVAATGHGNKHTAGVVTATGSSAAAVTTASGNSNAGGNGKGNGGGNGKGKDG